MKYTELEVVKNNQLCDIMHEAFPEYQVYELKDMLGILTDTIETLIKDQKTVVQLENFGNFWYTEHQATKGLFMNKGDQTFRKVKFKVSRSLQNRLREK